jgi:membrane associated rhomboid family serine protease
MQSSDGMTQLGLPKPGKALMGLMIAISAIWLMFAIGLNWGGASNTIFVALLGNTDAILHGQVWRLFTAPLLHHPYGSEGVWHMLGAVAGLYFLGARLEEHWGARRFFRFIALTSVGAFVLQMLAQLVLPTSVSARLVGEYWYGMTPAIEAIAIAWALTFRGQQVRLFMVLPVTSSMLIVFIIGLSLLNVIAAAEMPPAGLLAPFGGMFLGWLLGGGTPSPLRKAWLKLRLAQLDGEARREGSRRKARRNPGGLRVIPGGRADDDDDGKGPDGRWLN